MKLPYVIDNQTHVLADILKEPLTEHQGRSLDVATAYFTVGGFGLVQDGLTVLGNLRLLLGAEPDRFTGIFRARKTLSCFSLLSRICERPLAVTNQERKALEPNY